MRHLLSVFLLCACLFGLGACDSTPNPTPEAGPVVEPDAGPDAVPVIPAAYTLLTPSYSVAHSVPWNKDLEAPLRFAFVPRAGRHYDLIVEPGTEGHILEMRDAAGVTLDYKVTWDYGPSRLFSHFHWSGLTGNAVYTVDVRPSYSEARFPFTFRFVEKGLDDHADLYVTATQWVPSEQPLTGITEHFGERDLHWFQTVAGNVYALACTFPTSNWELSFRNQRGQNYGFAESTFSIEDTTQGGLAFKSPGGVFYAEVQELEAANAPYSCVLRDMGPEDHGDTVETATALPAGTASVQAKMEVLSDSDVFSLAVLPRHHYRVSCTIDGRKMCDVTSAAPGGEFSSPPSSDRTRTTFKASEATQFVRAQTSDGIPALWVEGHYTLQFEDLGEDDYGDTLATATPLTGPVQAVPGRIPDTFDHDFFSFEATAGRSYQFGCDWKTNPAQEQLYADFRNAQGEWVSAPRERIGSRWVQTYKAPQTATYGIDLHVYSLFTGPAPSLGDYACEFRVLDP